MALPLTLILPPLPPPMPSHWKAYFRSPPSSTPIGGFPLVHARLGCAVDHPRGRKNSNVVKMDVFYSMWGAQTVPCPWGSGKPACKATLLHHEQ
eukprot:scaffold31323_cov12-Tisochrysis_lutea.AAC.1